MGLFKLIARAKADIFSSDVESFFTDEEKETRALIVAARFGRGNVNLQAGRVLTARRLKNRMDRYQKRIEEGSFFFSR